MKKIILIIVCILFAGVAHSSDWVDGVKQDEFETTVWGGINQPSVSSSNSAKVYYDSTADKLKISENGSSYTNLLNNQASDISTDTTNFDNNLSAADDTVQKALDTLDDTAGGGGTTEDVFKTHDTPQGTDPVADSSTDTLQWLEGEGIDITGDSSADSITIAGEDASTTNKGIASFNATRFTVSNGAVDIQSVSGITGADEDDVTDDNVESMTTAGASGTAPISDGVGNLTMTDVITETELDSEAELESQLTDATNVYTDNDGNLTDDDLSDNSIDDLSDVNIGTPSDNDSLTWDSTTSKWIPEAVSTSPGGSDTQIQFNDGGSFGGDSGFTYDKTNHIASYESTRTINDLYHIVDKKYVDEAVTALGARYYMLDADSGEADYKDCSITPSAGAEQSVSKADLTDDEYIQGWISPNTNEPDKLIAGVYDWRIYAAKTDGTKTLRLYWKLVERKNDDSETVIGTSVVSNEVTFGKNSYIIPLTLSADHDIASDSYVVGKIYADVSGGGSAPSVTLYYEGSSDSHWEIPVNTEILDDRYVNVSGDTMTGALSTATIDTGSGAMELGDAAITNGDTDSIPTNDQVYDFCETTQQYLQIGDLSCAIHFTIDGGGSAITTGAKSWVRVPFDMTITGWDITADQSGSIVVDVWKDTYANFPPIDADSIAGTELPTLSSAQKNQDTSLSSWTTSVSQGDYIRINVDSASTVTFVYLTIYGTRS